MIDQSVISFMQKVVVNIPSDWLTLTTHRLDIYNESLAKTEFLAHFELLYDKNQFEHKALHTLPTAYDYIRLGHPLSSILEWTIGQMNDTNPHNVISFSSQTMPILAVLRKNLLYEKTTCIYYTDTLPEQLDVSLLRSVYHYPFELIKVTDPDQITASEGSNIYVGSQSLSGAVKLNEYIDFYLDIKDTLGSVLLINGGQNDHYVSSIQHVRRRETIAMTPTNCLSALRQLVGQPVITSELNPITEKASVLQSISKITATHTPALLGSSGLSIQYAIMMGLVHHAQETYPNKGIRIVIPPNCYGGTNDQARRVAACFDDVSILDLPVDGDNNMVNSTDQVLETVAKEDAVPLIIAEIPTNPRVEVPDLQLLGQSLRKQRYTSTGTDAISPIFILDQTFCPNVQFLAANSTFSSIQTIAYVSGSKFPSGGKCTAGYCVANQEAAPLMDKIQQHLQLCNNEATALQVKILSEQLPSMNERILKAYHNTRDFVEFIKETLPKAKINFVSESLATAGFTPSVFSLDLPTKGDTPEERESYKRKLNHQLIQLMIDEIPEESKYCVSYGQLKGCYWTVPATSTQGTTKESDKDYIARVSLSPSLNLQRHKEVFLQFVSEI